jgi:nucleotide-binding universal stress UspA family protein
VVVGDACDEILRVAHGADLVVAGQRGGNPFKGLLTGSSADRLLRTCRRPVLIVFLGGVTRRLVSASKCDLLVVPRTAAKLLSPQLRVVSQPGAARDGAQAWPA